VNHETLQELLPLHVLGILSAAETAAVEEHLASGCASCAAEHRKLSQTAADLAWSVTPVPPPARVRDAVLAAVARSARPVQVWKSWSAETPDTGLGIVRASEGTWETVTEGISVKRLAYDPDRQTTTMLIRMAAGTAYPSHRHARAEECYVLEGDLHIGDSIVMHAGDFQRAGAASVHLPQSTQDGCLLLITSSLEDELLG
jgi:anti-sigma factor ChrR (cupin superfamily)